MFHLAKIITCPWLRAIIRKRRNSIYAPGSKSESCCIFKRDIAPWLRSIRIGIRCSAGGWSARVGLEAFQPYIARIGGVRSFYWNHRTVLVYIDGGRSPIVCHHYVCPFADGRLPVESTSWKKDSSFPPCAICGVLIQTETVKLCMAGNEVPELETTAYPVEE